MVLLGLSVSFAPSGVDAGIWSASDPSQDFEGAQHLGAMDGEYTVRVPGGEYGARRKVVWACSGYQEAYFSMANGHTDTKCRKELTPKETGVEVDGSRHNNPFDHTVTTLTSDGSIIGNPRDVEEWDSDENPPYGWSEAIH